MSRGATIEPIKSIDEVLDWTTYFFNYAPSAFEVPLRPSSAKRCFQERAGGVLLKVFGSGSNDLPRTLLCHDMQGGYLDDKYITGTENNSFYHFYHWNVVDIFVYFSHHLVTIPPPHWVASAHLHGVAVLGTFLTEHDAGREALLRITSDPFEVEKVAKNLAKIAYFYNFDGWLINLENSVPRNRVDALLHFTDTLTKETRRLKGGKSIVLWYDAVTTEGKLSWQNELNNLNKPFFDLCDGIFLNYTWRQSNLESSLENAGIRKCDVYVGLDVFGRGMVGNGGFHTRKAAEIARRYDLSLAVFAHAWTYETFHGEAFTELENLFWALLAPYLYLKGPKKLPFRTSFSRGVGKRMYHRGVPSGGSWWNLSRQQYQPLWATPEAARAADLRMMEVVPYAQASYPDWESVKSKVHALEAIQPYDDDAWFGGSCLKIVSIPGLFDSDYNRLFVCDLDLSLPVVVRYGYKYAPDNNVVPISSSPTASDSASSSVSDSSETYDENMLAVVLKLRHPLSPERNGTTLRLAADRKAAILLPVDAPANGKPEILVEPVADREVNGWEFRAFRVRCTKVGYQISEVAFSLGANSAVLLGFFSVEFGRA